MATAREQAEMIGFSLLEIDRSSEATIHRQLFSRIREAIAAGNLRSGSRLPSTRAIAEALAISRNTVAEVFSQLVAEGYAIGRPGSGTYVALGEGTAPLSPPRAQAAWERASLRGRLLLNTDVSARMAEKSILPFQVGIPALEQFPFDVWSRIAAKVMRKPSPAFLSYGDPAGYRPLREAIAAQLRARKGIACSADQIVVVGGTQQALDLVCRLTIDPGDEVWIEDPSSLQVRAAFRSSGASVVPVPVDADGLDVALGRRVAPHARLAHVTPAHQWPLGPVMSPARRAALLEWAHEADAWIVEDEYDGTFRYESERVEHLRAIEADRVIWIASFSLTTFPALRIGYLIAPAELVDAFVAAKATADGQTATLEQAVLAEFIYEGHYVRHLGRMREIYEERRNRLAAMLEDRLGERVAVPAAGLHVMFPLRDGANDVRLEARAKERGIVARALSPFYAERTRSGLLLGFGLADRISVTRVADTLCGLIAETNGTSVKRRTMPRAFRDVPG